MDVVKQSSVNTDQQSNEYVQLLEDYTPSDDIPLHRGDHCLVLGRYGDEWIYVSNEEHAKPVYVPTSWVRRVDNSSNWSSFDMQNIRSSNSVSVTRASTLKPMSSNAMTTAWAGVTRSKSLRNSCQVSLTRRQGSDSEDDDLPEPPKPFQLSSSSDPSTVSMTSSLSSYAGKPHDVMHDRQGIDHEADDTDTSNSNVQSHETKRSSESARQSLTDENTTELYSNWAEIQRIAGAVKDSTLKRSSQSGLREPINLPIPTENMTKSPSQTATLPKSNKGMIVESQTEVSTNSSSALEVKTDDPSNTSMMNRRGNMQCLHEIENGKAVRPTQWTPMYLVLHGALLSVYADESSAEPRSDGFIPLPKSSLGLQGAAVHLTRYDYPAYDVIRVTTSCNTQYLLQATTTQETQAWCQCLKHNVAVLLADRTARIESATPVSTYRTSPKLRGKLINRTESSSTMSRVAQRLKELLVRRPTKEDLRSRGIYTDPMFGSTLAAICTHDRSSVPIFLMNCFKEIEARGLTISGIYRLSGSISKVQQLRIRANQGDYNVSDIEDIHTLTGIVRLFFRELSDPLVPFEFFERFCDSYQGKHNHSSKKEAFIHLIQNLPEENRRTMHELFKHLEKVMEHSAENQMTSHNLAIVFGPTLMWLPVHKDQNYSSTVVLQGQIVEYLLKEYRQIFVNKAV